MHKRNVSNPTRHHSSKGQTLVKTLQPVDSNPLPNNKILDYWYSKLKPLADNKINATQKFKFVNEMSR